MDCGDCDLYVSSVCISMDHDIDPLEPRLSAWFATSMREERSHDRSDRVKPRHWRFRREKQKSSSSSSSSKCSRRSLGVANDVAALSESLLLLSSSSKEGHSMAGKAIVSSTCWDACKNSPMSKDPDSPKRDRVRLRGADRWESVLLPPTTLGKPEAARFAVCCSFPMLIRAFVAKSLLIWIIFSNVVCAYTCLKKNGVGLEVYVIYDIHWWMFWLSHCEVWDVQWPYFAVVSPERKNFNQEFEVRTPRFPVYWVLNTSGFDTRNRFSTCVVRN